MKKTYILKLLDQRSVGLKAKKAPIFYSGASFQGARRVIYPYALNDVISHEKKEKAWKALMLENEYIKLCITPDIGGKLYYATDKSNDYNFIYKNNEVKPSNIGMTGAWVSGGIEWCVFHHHRASTMLPMDYSMAENEDGSKTIFIGETEPRHRMRWTVGVTVRPGPDEAEVVTSECDAFVVVPLITQKRDVDNSFVLARRHKNF